MKRRKLLNRSADFKFDKVGYITGMCYEMSSSIVYLKKIVKHINETKLIGKLQMEIIVHDVEKLYVVAYKNQALWSGEKEKIEAFKKLSVTALIMLLVSRINEVDINDM